MTRWCTLFAICALVAGCGESSPGKTLIGPTPVGTGTTPTGSYTLTGTVRNLDGAAVAGALILLDGRYQGRSSVSDADGTYRLDDLSGAVTLRVSMDGYVDLSMSLFVAADQALNIALERLVTLVPGTTLRGTVHGAPCDPQGWDARAPCQRVFFTPSTSGTLDLVLTWTGASELDLLFVQGPYFGAPFAGREIRGSVNVLGGVRYEIWINSYYDTPEFELRSEFRPTS